MEILRDFIFGGSKITADGDCSHEIKRCLLLGRKAMTNLHSVLKSRDIIWPTKVHLVKSMVFAIVKYGYDHLESLLCAADCPKKKDVGSCSRMLLSQAQHLESKEKWNGESE